MRKLELTVRFNTPAFLGNAEQSSQWRTPPFKALLRQWWRIAAANGFGYDSERLREAEGLLFGTAGENQSRQSAVRMRLDRWDHGVLRSWEQDTQVFHREVRGGRNIGAQLYLGYGPLTFAQGKTVLKANAAIQAGHHARLHVAFPTHTNGALVSGLTDRAISQAAAALPEALQLIHWFGTIGGRSRNGWGSLALTGGDIQSVAIPAASDPLIAEIALPLDQCLRQDWPHALGKDARGVLFWKSKQEFPTWRDAMTTLAKAKIGFRTHLKFTHGRNGPFEDRHLLAYPVTNHNVEKLPREARLANQLRFKVAKTANGKFVSMIFHLPCALPYELAQKLGPNKPNVDKQAEVWSRVHAWLDSSASVFQRI
ncbi:hypothetical protein [Methylocaldum szegediense]|uniref:CRISPR-associated protein Cmr1 n=1 Tax=Methylocaldum szegediense TaxID=73780 RepID=A0ABN8X243_9GAMM|nr:hypothetical protein [Methylocaldum szegediense]CAI8771648.1 CRISPR-associated protein Cmr1 [Methylocaldum szegediense]